MAINKYINTSDVVELTGRTTEEIRGLAVPQSRPSFGVFYLRIFAVPQIVRTFAKNNGSTRKRGIGSMRKRINEKTVKRGNGLTTKMINS